ncbi:two component transcriptional regulator, LuxR family [Verrucomicrobium sp. GAS474]|uniref:response regulator transcription factor n=1 Tax=Verrucomicrobium sp. GAS474 TaxID=1882831 RepID=UPI00087B0A0B|nr:response regulator transcription factor [Verrucomicrobium sp. GAS474]SDU00649.1 two component transcriptional regulator, LuxR family [Verrucomicrobium sp. GAS474]
MAKRPPTLLARLVPPTESKPRNRSNAKSKAEAKPKPQRPPAPKKGRPIAPFQNKAQGAPVRIAILDDQPLVILGLTVSLEETGNFTLCGQATTIPDARELIEQARPDVTILDLSLGGRDGVEFLEELHRLHPAGKILVLTACDENLYARWAFRAGASGYLMKTSGPEEVIAALRTILRGNKAASESLQQAALARALGEGGVSPSSTPLHGLSQRELQVFSHLGGGKTTSEIAGLLNLGVKTIGTYRERLKDKLGLLTGPELEESARQYVRNGIIPEVGKR